MRVLVCGGRSFGIDVGQRNLIFLTLYKLCKEFNLGYVENDNWLPENLLIIAGGARGADSVAVDWAVVNWCPFVEYNADWSKYGKSAGAIRNRQMLVEGQPDLVIAFPGGRGTENMVNQAKKAGVPVRIVPYP